MTYQEALDYIHSFEQFGWVLGLERMQRLLENLGNPQDRLQFIHIAGTNGKGSTTMLCAKVLELSGYRCGMYTSPYVVDFRERFQINGKMIGKEEFASYAERIRVEVEALRELGVQITEFEAITAIAFLWFQEQHCDIVCLEVGLGGNYDATNVIKTPLVSTIASISLDHVHILGDTIEQIAGEKAGIIKQNGVCVSYPKQAVEAVAVFMEQCAKTKSLFVQANPNAVQILEHTAFGNRFVYEGETYTTKLAGEHQVFNAVNVIETMKQLRKKGFAISMDCLREGIAQTTFVARFERLCDKPLIVADGAHNLEGMTALSETIRTVQARKKWAIMGMLADKDYEHSLAVLSAVVDGIICVPVDNPRALDCETLAEAAATYCEKVSFERNHRKAVQQALAQLHEEDFLIICGSLYMVGTVRGIALEEL